MTITTYPDLASYGVESHWRTDAPAQRRLLVVYAHPDDESFGNAGTIIRYSRAGVEVHYVCATRGEAGTVEPGLLADHVDVGALRTAELFHAADALGLAGLHFLNYRDSGMVGTPDNQHPSAFVQAPVEHVTGQVVALIRALRPQVVLTFGPYGGYGHPDHIAIHRATLLAFRLAGDATRYIEQIDAGLAAWTPRKLYYPTFSPRFLQITVAMMRLLRRDPARFGQNGDVDLVRAAAEITPTTTRIDSGVYLRAKEQAWAAHHSQFNGRSILQRLPAPLRKRFFAYEYFTRVIPAWVDEAAREDDLFAQL